MMVWAFTVIEVAVGAWLALFGDYPVLGGFIMGGAMGAQLARITQVIRRAA